MIIKKGRRFLFVRNNRLKYLEKKIYKSNKIFRMYYENLNLLILYIYL